jgi:hypothetical protein
MGPGERAVQATSGLLLIGLLASPPAPAIAPDDALLSVEAPPPGAAAVLRADGVAVVRDLGSFLLVVTDPAGRARAEARGMAVRTLDESVAGKTYYTVSLRGRAPEPLGAAGRILREDGRDAVLETDPERAEALAAGGFDIARVFLRPVRPAPARPALPGPRGASWNPLIDEMVRSVSGPAIDADVSRLEAFVTRYCRSDSARAAAEWIRARFLAVGLDSVSLHEWDPVYSPNVVAVMPGWYEPGVSVVVGGHYDSISQYSQSAPGADDNASGTALMLEAARVLAGRRFERTLVFVAFGGEELGLLGSEAWAAAAAARGDRITAMINADMVGYVAPGDALDLDVITDTASGWLRDLAFHAGATYVADLPVIEGALPGGATSDHASFWAHGYPALQLWEDSSCSPWIHSASDGVGLSYNAPPLAQGFARLAVATAAELAGPLPIAIAHAPAADLPLPAACRISARIVADAALVPDSVALHWRAGGPWQTVALVPAAVPGEHEAWIPAQAAGSRVEYWLSAADASGASVADPRTAPGITHSYYVGTPITAFSDDAETDRGWTCGATDDDAVTGRWIRADPVGTWDLGLPVQPEDDHGADGVRCFVTGNAGAGQPVGVNDVDGGRTTLLSPVLDLSAWPGGRVRYWRWYVNDTPMEAPADVWMVDVSSDGGSTWTAMETCAQSDRAWRVVERDLAAYVPLTAAVRFRFIASDAGTGSFVEAALDDFSVAVFPPGATAALPPAPAPAGAVALGAPVPNPSAGPCRIAFTAPRAGPVTLQVLDVGGRLVATLAGESAPAGAGGGRVVTWDGRDGRGRLAAAGVYVVRLDANGKTATRKLVRIR